MFRFDYSKHTQEDRYGYIPEGVSLTQRKTEARGKELFVSNQVDFTQQPYGGMPPFAKMSDTSREAALSMAGKAGSVRRKVYECIANSRGLTDEEMEARLGMKHQTATARRCELVQLKLVEDSGERRVASSGRKQAVWQAALNPPRAMTLEEREAHGRMKEELFRKIPDDDKAKRVIRWLLTGLDEVWEGDNLDRLCVVRRWLGYE
jgi:hypothetical protein